MILPLQARCAWSCHLNQVTTLTSSLISCQPGLGPNTGDFIPSSLKVLRKITVLWRIFFYCGCVCLGYIPCSLTTVEPLVATTTQKQPPLLNKQFAKIPKVSQSSLYLESLVSDHLLLVTTTTFRARSLRIYLFLASTSQIIEHSSCE